MNDTTNPKTGDRHDRDLIRQLEIEILKFFSSQQDAGASLHQISSLCLLAVSRTRLEQVKLALSHLIECGVLRTFGAGDSTVYIPADHALIKSLVVDIEKLDEGTRSAD